MNKHTRTMVWGFALVIFSAPTVGKLGNMLIHGTLTGVGHYLQLALCTYICFVGLTKIVNVTN